MNTPNSLQIFKPGKHTAMSGAQLAFSETDLAATAAAYDPAKHDAPLVVGHPRHDDPAYGWVGKLSFADGALEAEHRDVDPAFAEMVAKKRFKKISASFYAPDSPSNPVPGVYYLRHVGFLGAQAPAVKGLRTPEFADAEQGVVEFSEWDDVDNAGLWRSLREWFIGKFGLDEADKVIPSYRVTSLEQGAQDELREAQTQHGAAEPTGAGAFAERPLPQSGLPANVSGVQQEQNAGAGVAASFTEGDEMSAEDKARLAVLEAENARLKADQAAFAEAEKKRTADARHADHTAFAEGLVKAGKLLPLHKGAAVAALDFMAGQEQVVEFSSGQPSALTSMNPTLAFSEKGELLFGEGDVKQPLIAGFKALLEANPKQVEFSEVAGASGVTPAGVVDFAAPPGGVVDQDQLALRNAALSYQEKNPGVDFIAAVLAVQKQ